jgi:Do/DeqQ family serine protease
MSDVHFPLFRRTGRIWLAGLAVLALLGGAAWRGVDAQVTPGGAATVTSPIAHAVAGGRDSYADVVEVVSPAVVTIRAEGKARALPTQFQFPDDDALRRFFGDQFPRGPREPRAQKQRALGSGVIVTTDGYLLTNHHVVDGADNIEVDLADGRTFTAKVIGTDRPSDLALLKISGADLHAVAFGNSDRVRVGDVVLALGNPLGVGQTVTMGIISAKGRSTTVGDGSYEDFLQTDAPINQGNSGGALVNSTGELVGINSQILSTSAGNIGIGFSIPANMAKRVMEDLRTKGRVSRGQLGVTVQSVTSDMAANLGLKQASGAIVSAVAPGGAAERAGIRRGDVIESFNGQPVHDTNTLRNRVAEAGPGTKAEVSILRDGSERHLAVTLDEASPSRSARRGDGQPGGADASDSTALGVSVTPLTPDLAARVGAPKDARGLLVQDVAQDGRAASAGIRSGDVIEEVNRQPVQTVEELRAALARSADKPVLLLVMRQGANVFVTVPLAKD